MIAFLTNYWYIVGIAVLVAAFFIVKQFAKGHAKDVAMAYLYEAEKMVFDNSDAKLAYVSEMAYTVLPKSVKLLIPRTLFSLIVVEVYSGVKQLVEYKKLSEQQPTAPTTPAVPATKPAAPIAPAATVTPSDEHARKQG